MTGIEPAHHSYKDGDFLFLGYEDRTKVRDYTGHKSIETSQNYIYDITTNKKKNRLLAHSLDNMSGLNKILESFTITFGV